MPRDIFGEVVDPTPRLGSRSRYAVPLSVAAHAAVAAVVIIIPLMATDVMPDPREVMHVVAGPAALPLPPPPPPARSSAPAATTPPSRQAAPSAAPDSITPEPETTVAAIGDPLGVPGGLPDGVPGGLGVVSGVPALPAPPPPPPVTRPVPVGGRIKIPAKVLHVPPVYPAIAQQARVEGVVIIEAIIGTDGRVKEARVLKSRPLLDEAALAAVRQWVFSPTTLNGVPVPVLMTVTVNFRLR
jgi:protein TonB